jgi:hypothetical protein
MSMLALALTVGGVALPVVSLAGIVYTLKSVGTGNTIADIRPKIVAFGALLVVGAVMLLFGILLMSSLAGVSGCNVPAVAPQGQQMAPRGQQMAPLMMQRGFQSDDISGTWIVVSSTYSGNITFNPDGTGLALIQGKPDVPFSWHSTTENNYEADVLLVAVPFVYDPDTGRLTSELKYPGSYLVREDAV